MIRVECSWAWAKESALAGSLVHFVLVSGVCEGGDRGDEGACSPLALFLKWPDLESGLLS